MTTVAEVHPPDVLSDAEWRSMPLTLVLLDGLRFSYHAVSGEQVDRWLSMATWPPIYVDIVDGTPWVQDGRHRVVAARHRGRRRILARVHQVDPQEERA